MDDTKVLYEYRVALSRTLPMDNPKFIKLLKRFFVGNQLPMMESLPTSAHKVSFLLDIIEKSIAV